MTKTDVRSRTWWTSPRKAVAGSLFAAAMFVVGATAYLVADSGALAASFAVLAVMFLGLAAVFYVST